MCVFVYVNADAYEIFKIFLTLYEISLANSK